MDSKQRFLMALSGQIPDRVPIFDFPTQRALFEAVIGRRPTSYNGRDVTEVSIALGLDAAWIPLGGTLASSLTGSSPGSPIATNGG